MRFLTIGLLLLFASASTAQTACEIFVFDVTVGETTSISNGQNISKHVGYDNQPHFHPTKPILYYTSFNKDGRADIKTYNFRSREMKKLTTTHEREYSPTVTPDGKFISCIIQRDNNSQDLGKYPIDGGTPIVLIDNLTVGYHCWMPGDLLLLFVLGDDMTLQVFDLSTKKSTIIAKNIGRSLHRIPNQNAMSFVQKSDDDKWMIKRIDIATLKITDILPTLENQEDICWMPDGRILSSNGNQIFISHLTPSAERPWVTVDMGEIKLTDITRLAISRDGKRLAVVAGE